MLTLDEICMAVHGVKAKDMKKPPEFETFDKYLTLVQSEAKFFEALEYFSKDVTTFMGPVMLRHFVNAANKYPKRQEDIKRIIHTYHDNCRKDSNPIRFASSYAVVKENGGFITNSNTGSVLNIIEGCVANDAWLTVNEHFGNDLKGKTAKDLYQYKKKIFDEVMVNQAGILASDMYKEGVKNNFSVLPSQESSLRTEMKSTATAEFKTDPKNPDVMNIEGTDKDGKHTFSFRVDKTTGYYTYAGGKPEKIFSNEPGSKHPQLPAGDLECLKYNNRLSKTVATRNVILRVGVQYKDGDKTVTVSRPRRECVEIRVAGADGKSDNWFCMDTRTGKYRATNFKTGKKYSNIPEDKGKCDGELPKHIMDLCMKRTDKGMAIAKNMAMTFGNSQAKDMSNTK